MSNTNGKIRCPFCGAKLAECFISTKDLTCSNPLCQYSTIPMPLQTWELLIEGTKLPNVQKALDEAKRCINFAIWAINNPYLSDNYPDKIAGCCHIALERINKLMVSKVE